MTFLTLILILVLCLPVRSVEKSHDHEICYPPPNPSTQQFIIGFGSLMQEKSKRQTDPSAGDSIPVRVRGYERTWDAQGDSISKYSTTFLGIRPNSNASFNGVIFPLSEGSLGSYDHREDWYCRTRVQRNQIQFLNGGDGIEGEYWIYVPRPSHSAYPDEKHPILLSYVYIFLSGCLQLEQKFNLPGFGEECLNSTTEWRTHWLNNRQPNQKSTEEEKIHVLLEKGLPTLYPNLKFQEVSSGGGSGESGKWLVIPFFILSIMFEL